MARDNKNPFKNLNVDQFHKLRRKRELKKNKLQRDATRKAVLKNQNHVELIQEMERIDSSLFNPSREGTDVHENVLKAKRSKLREKFMKMIDMYEKEDPEMAKELKAAEAEYLKKRVELMSMYEQIKKAVNVDINCIALPSEPSSYPMVDPAMVGHIPLPRVAMPQVNLSLKNLRPPGPPPGPPPSLSDLEDDNMEGQAPANDDTPSEQCDANASSRITTDPKELRTVEPKHVVPHPPLAPCPTPAAHCQLQPTMLPSFPHGVMPRPPPGPPPMIHRPLNGATPFGSSSTQTGCPSSYVNQGTHYRPAMPRGPAPSRPNPPALDANNNARSRTSKQNSAVISGAPQLRNLVGEAIQFMPSALMVKRQANAGRVPLPAATASRPTRSNVSQLKPEASTNDAFNDFMNEINMLL